LHSRLSQRNQKSFRPFR